MRPHPPPYSPVSRDSRSFRAAWPNPPRYRHRRVTALALNVDGALGSLTTVLRRATRWAAAHGWRVGVRLNSAARLRLAAPLRLGSSSSERLDSLSNVHCVD